MSARHDPSASNRSAPLDALVVAAVAGLFAHCSGGDGDGGPRDRCDTPTTTHTDTDPTDTEPTDTDTTDPTPPVPGPMVTSIEVDTTILFDDFKARCDAEGGLLQTTAACAGNNFCKGFSFNVNTKELMEHTCRGVNSCHGISCVVLPEDRGFDGQVVYESTCNYACHGPPTDSVKLLIPPGKDPVAAADEYLTKDRDYLVALVAFGMHGMNENGTGAAMAPARTEEWSVAELGRSIDWMRSLPFVVEEYGIVGVTIDLN